MWGPIAQNICIHKDNQELKLYIEYRVGNKHTHLMSSGNIVTDLVGLEEFPLLTIRAQTEPPSCIGICEIHESVPQDLTCSAKRKKQSPG